MTPEERDAAILLELRAVRGLLGDLLRAVRGASKATGTPGASTGRVQAWRAAKRSEGDRWIHGSRVRATATPAGRVQQGATDPVSPSQTLPSGSESLSFQSVNLTHSGKGATGCNTPKRVLHPAQTDNPCVPNFPSFTARECLEALQPAAPPLVLLPCDARWIQALEVVCRDLSGQGVTLDDIRSVATWIREGGLSWKTGAPADVLFLASPKGLARMIGPARAAQALRVNAEMLARKAADRKRNQPPKATREQLLDMLRARRESHDGR